MQVNKFVYFKNHNAEVSDHPPPHLRERLATLGSALRVRRKQLGLSAVAVAEAAEISRVTLHRIERGEPSVAMGAYFSTASALGVELEIVAPKTKRNLRDHPRESSRWISVEIHLQDYPQLDKLGWQLDKDKTLSPREALDIYERNWKHVDEETLSPDERTFIENLQLALGRKVFDV